MRSRWLIPPVEGALFCVAVFLLFLPERGPAQEKPDATVRFVSYNLKNYLGTPRRVGEAIVENAPKPEAEIEELLGAIADLQPSILGVCEIGGADFLHDFQSRLEKRGVVLPHAELVPSPDGWDRNLALLSQYPILETHSREDLTYEIGEQLLPFARGILDVTLQVNADYRLRCIGLHLKSKREVPEADQFQMRMNEALLVRKHIDRLLADAPDTNLLVYGDLNSLRIESPVKVIQGGYGNPDYLSALGLADEKGERWTHYWDDADVYSRFDYILYSKGLSQEIDRSGSFIHHWPGWYRASDHRPLVVSLIPANR